MWLLRAVWAIFRESAKAIVWLVDWAGRTYVRYTHPKHAVAGWLVLNLAISIPAWLLTGTWNDFFTVAGYWVTLSGLLVTLFELYRARTVSEHVRKAVDREIRRQRDLHYRFCLELAMASLQQMRTQAHDRMWKAAAIKLRDLTDALSRVNAVSAAADDFWNLSTEGLHAWVVRFESGKDRQHLQYNNMVEWEQLIHSISDRLHGELAVEQPGEEGGHDPE